MADPSAEERAARCWDAWGGESEMDLLSAMADEIRAAEAAARREGKLEGAQACIAAVEALDLPANAGDWLHGRRDAECACDDVIRALIAAEEAEGGA